MYSVEMMKHGKQWHVFVVKQGQKVELGGHYYRGSKDRVLYGSFDTYLDALEAKKEAIELIRQGSNDEGT